MPGSSSSLDSPQATQAQLASLMKHILDDDVINLEARCPTAPTPDLTADELTHCYRLAWQLLTSGMSMSATRRLVSSIAIRCSATPEQAIGFKLMRARFKKMRFACANYSENHSYPKKLHSLTRLMGSFQDAYKNGLNFRTRLLGVWLWCRLRSSFYQDLHETLIKYRFSTVESFQRYIATENQYLNAAAHENAFLTAKQFHELRKVISRRIALNDTRRALYPSAELDAVSLFLATINGLMGQMHDDLVLKKIRNELDYERELFKLPDQIGSRIRTWVTAQCSA